MPPESYHTIRKLTIYAASLPGVLLLTCLLSANCFGQAAIAIRVNQLGFSPLASKLAIIESSAEGELPFALLNCASGKIVFRGHTGAVRHSAFLSGGTHVADFSRFRDTGRFQLLLLPDLGRSPAFPISYHPYNAVAAGALKAFYYIRSSVALTTAYAGPWSRPAGHADTAVMVHSSAATPARPAGTLISSSGGWYDAGDYNKYIVNSGITVGTLLSAYEDFPDYYDTLNTHIPESGNHMPDLLDEILYNLRWMLSMQDPYDGGVYHKCTYASFDPMVMPGVTGRPRYVVEKSTAATLDFAAVMAQAARVFRLPRLNSMALADSCINAASSAWQWAIRHPATIYDQNALNRQYDPDITTGAYGDRRLGDEWFWAAAELYISTHLRIYYDSVKRGIPDSLITGSWSNVTMPACLSLLRKGSGLLPAEMLERFQTELLQYADKLSLQRSSNALDCAMGYSPGDFVWGSNAVAANQALALINAWKIGRKAEYLAAAVSNFDYLLGRNATGYCFVTGYGSRQVMHPHHRPSVADGVEAPVPGLLSGGPNPGQQDRCAGYPSREPARSFLDSSCAYASNEIAINWNAPLVYLANAMVVLPGK